MQALLNFLSQSSYSAFWFVIIFAITAGSFCSVIQQIVWLINKGEVRYVTKYVDNPCPRCNPVDDEDEDEDEDED
jgi:hypothetical protein